MHGTSQGNFFSSQNKLYDKLGTFGRLEEVAKKLELEAAKENVSEEEMKKQLDGL